MEKKLYRSRDGIIGGVCTGIADYMGIDPLIVQILFVILHWTVVPIILIYLFLWLSMGKEPKF